MRSPAVPRGVNIPTAAGNVSMKDGAIPGKLKQILDQLKPEAVYFAEDEGERTAHIFLDMAQRTHHGATRDRTCRQKLRLARILRSEAINMHLIISFLLNALALWLLTIVYKGVHADTTTALMIAALIFGIVNAIVRPILLVLSLPFIILTLGLFVFVVNGIVLWIVGAVVPGFHVYGLWAGIIGAIILGIISWIINAIALRSRLASDSAR